MPIDAQIQEFLAVWQAAWAELPPGAAHGDRRLLFERIAREHRPPTPPGIEVRERFVPWQDRFVRLREFRPSPRVDGSGSAGPLPAVIFMHGGGWMEGSPETHWDSTAAIAACTGASVLSIDYSRTPENPFPIAVSECIGVARWVRANAGQWGLDATRLALWGDSAGGNLAAACALALRDAGVPLRAQVLVYPVLGFDRDRPSYRENANGPMIVVSTMDDVDGLYCPRPEDRANPLAAPLRAPDHRGLAPAWIAVAQFDPLRDDGHAYALALRDAGVPVVLHPGEGLIHGYLRAVQWSAAARAAFAQAMDWLAGRLA